MIRLDRLDLTRYGRFTGTCLDFGTRPADAPDLHIVYGPNEAGKSTTLSAFLDLLFGIEMQSRYNFLHPYGSMRIGARLGLDGGARELVRVKKQQNSLLDAGNQPVGEHVLAGALSGIGRDAYRAMFSLDDETLEAGGKSILASKGDLGELLFSGSAGLATLGDTLTRLRGVADGFFKLHSRNSELSALKNRLAGLKARRDELDVRSSDHAALVAARDRAEASYADRMADRATAAQRRDRVKALLAALPWLGRWRDLQAELAPLRDLPEAPVAWVAEVEALSQGEIALGVRRQGVVDAIARLEAERDGIVVDMAALDMAPRLEGLDDLRARYVTAMQDLPDRRLRLGVARRAVADVLHRLERPADTDPGSLILPVQVAGALRTAMESRSGIAAALQAARQEADDAERKLAELRALLPEEVPAGGGAIAALSALLDQQRDLDHAARRRVALTDIGRHAEALAGRIALLHPWTGEASALTRMAVPTATEIQAWQAAQAQSQAEIGRHADEVARRVDEQVQLRARLDALRGTAGLVDDAEALHARAARDAAWDAHLAALDPVTAEAFAAEMHRHDRLADARLAHAGDLATLHELAQDLAVAQAAEQRAAARLAAARDADAARQAEIAAAIGRISPLLPPDMSLPQLDAWLRHRGDALATADLHAAAGQMRRAAEADAVEARDRLLQALTAAGVPHDPEAGDDALRAEALAAVARAHQHDSLRQRIEAQQRDLARRRERLEAATRAMADWEADWAATCGRCWFGAGGAIPGIVIVREILAALDSLVAPATACDGLVHRIAMMEAEAREFDDAIGGLAAALSLDPSLRRPMDRWNALQARLDAARRAQAARADKESERVARVEELRAVDAEAAIQDRRISEMAAFFGVATLGEVRAALQRIERRRDLDRQAAERARDICAALQVGSMAEAVGLLDAADREALTAELARVEAQFAATDEEARAAFAEKTTARQRLDAIGGDNAVALLEEQRHTLLLDISDKALRHLRLRAGILAAEQALRLYRERHRSSMMRRASDAFHTISRGAYRGLATQPEKDSEVLIGLGADGSSKLAPDMSKGTRFQLYLALRVAGYHEFAATRGTVPFVADDIMETFDDFRAEEAFALLADMARVGQVIYLTHHRHLCDIARQVCPGVRIHELPGPG